MSGQDKSQAANEQARVTLLDDMPIFLGSLGAAVPLCSTKNGYLTISNHRGLVTQLFGFLVPWCSHRNHHTTEVLPRCRSPKPPATLLAAAANPAAGGVGSRCRVAGDLGRVGDLHGDGFEEMNTIGFEEMNCFMVRCEAITTPRCTIPRQLQSRYEILVLDGKHM